MVKEETVNGMRIDTFFTDSDTLSEERLEPHRTREAEKKVCEELIALLQQDNRLT